jgi:hypothetical protein
MESKMNGLNSLRHNPNPLKLQTMKKVTSLFTKRQLLESLIVSAILALIVMTRFIFKVKGK